MIDFYWLKSFTEIMQLFLSVLFLIYLKIKFDSSKPVIFWLTLFFYIKLGTDLYGILNYTSWISDILTRSVLNIYRSAMGSLELGMIASFILFVLSTKNRQLNPRNNRLFFIPAILLFPINILLIKYYQSTLLEVFDLIKLTWIGTMLYLLGRTSSKELKTLIVVMLVWNVLWLAEVVLHQQLAIITESTSWIIFVISEGILTVGISYFLLQVIANPKILKVDDQEILPESLIRDIEIKLRIALEQDKIYTNPDLLATILADKLGISSNDLTTYLNRGLNKNFNQFILDYRINESKKLLASTSNAEKNIEQVMFESGFNSKSVFNTAFKEKTGFTPSQFRKEFKE